jgi:hypothetical protein
MKLKLLLSLFTFLSVGFNLFSQTNRYIDNVNGSTSNDGLTPATAVKLLSNGNLPNTFISTIVPGDTIFLIGTFQNNSYTTASPVGLPVNASRFWHAENTIRINNLNGNIGNYITFKPYDNSTILKGDGGNIFRVQNSSYLRFEGFNIEGEVNNLPLSVANLLQFVYILSSASSLTSPSMADIKYRDQDCISNCTPGAVVEGEIYSTLNPNQVYRPTYYDTRGLYLSDVHHIEIINNHIHHMPGGGLRVSDCEDILIKGNEINDCSRRSSGGTHGLVVTKATSTRTTDDYRIKIIGNKVHHNYNEQYSWAPDKIVITPHIDEGKGISLQRNETVPGVNWDNGRILIANNICYYNGFSGIHSNDGYRIDVINNTCYFNSYTKSITEWTGTPDPNGGNVGISIQDGAGHKIINNISVIDNNMTRSALATNITTPGAIMVKDNIIYGSTGPLSMPQDEEIEAVQINTQNIDPLFANASTFDFTLLSTSPAINNADEAYSSILENIDYFGNPRNDLDIGAIETQFVSLPIKLVYFNAFADNNRVVKLFWQTASEKNNHFFNIEKSIDGIIWENVAKIVGAGNSISTLNYSAVDNNPYIGKSFYRLKQTDFDGKFEYSQIKSVTLNPDNKNSFNVFPNPISNVVQILNKSNYQFLEIYNSYGQKIITYTVKQGANDLALYQLPIGIYFFKIGDSVQKVIKNSQ